MANPVLEQRYVGRIKPGMDVCDVGGDKVGSVAHVYRYASPEAAANAAGDEILEVKTGFFGLGQHLYVPMSAVQDVLGECVYVSKAKESFDALGWNEKPMHLTELQ